MLLQILKETNDPIGALRWKCHLPDALLGNYWRPTDLQTSLRTDTTGRE